jgi:hypothetical protein
LQRLTFDLEINEIAEIFRDWKCCLRPLINFSSTEHGLADRLFKASRVFGMVSHRAQYITIDPALLPEQGLDESLVVIERLDPALLE